jgi:cation diffusion facilitator family transporter
MNGALLLAKFYYGNITGRRVKKGLIACIVAAGVNLALGILKIYVGTAGYSMAIFTDGIQNLADSAACASGAVALRITARGATEKHPFGFGRAEHIVTLLIGVLMAATALGFVYACSERIFYRFPIYFTWTRAALIAFTVPVKLGLAAYLRAANRGIDSPVIKTEALDSLLDSALTATTVFSYIIAQYMLFPLDGVIGLLVCALIIYGGVRPLKNSISALIGRSMPTEKAELLKLLDGFEIFKELTELKLHYYGAKRKEAAAVVKIDKDASFDEALTAVDEVKKQALAEHNINLVIEIRRCD